MSWRATAAPTQPAFPGYRPFSSLLCSQRNRASRGGGQADDESAREICAAEFLLSSLLNLDTVFHLLWAIFFLSLLFVLDIRRIILEDRLKFPVVIGIIEEVVRRIFNFFFFCNLTLENVNGVLVASRHETLLANANIRRVFLRLTRKILYFEKYYRVLSLSSVKISYISIVLTIFLYTKTRFLSLRKFRKIRKNLRQ